MDKKVDSEKGPEKAKNWWELSKSIPEDKLNTVLWCSGGAAALFLVLWIVWISIASGRASKAEELEGKIASMSEAGAVEEANKKADEWKSKADEEASARRDAESKAKGLEGELSRATKEKDSFQKKLDAAKKENDARERKYRADLLKAHADLKSSKAAYKELERASKDVAALNKRLKRAEEDLRSTKKTLSDLRDETKGTKTEKDRMNKELQRLSREYEAKMTELKGQIEERTRRIDELSVKLAKFPGTPLTEELAKSRYREILAELGSVADRDERINRFFEAKQELAGTRYERSANRDWEKEKKLKQRDIDTAAAEVYKKAISEIRSRPQAYDDNVAILEKALEDGNVAKSRYRKAIDKLITKQMKLKAAAAAREAKAADAAAAAAEKEKEAEAEPE